MTAPERTEYLVCGGGIVGLSIARELLRRGASDITIVEKEPAVGLHASGRNSGVLHAGIYYAPDSLRARVCLAGNRLMKEYCRERGLPLLERGKVIVARDDREAAALDELRRRALANGAAAELIDERQLAGIEPNARTAGRALYSPETAVVDPRSVLAALTAGLAASGRVSILYGTAVTGSRGSDTALTTAGPVRFGTFVNAAGAHSDRVARLFSAGGRYRMVPFKGIYRKLSPAAAAGIRGNIYPVPDIRNPFLGVHFTRSVSGDVYLGPTAIPALGRENYGILSGIDTEMPAILCRDATLFASNAKFRTVAMTEPRKYLFSHFFNDARALVKELHPGEVRPSDKAGIRPQLVDWKTRELVMDFLVVRDGPAVHVLNAISPAFTSSFAFAELVVREHLLP